MGFSPLLDSYLQSLPDLFDDTSTSSARSSTRSCPAWRASCSSCAKPEGDCDHRRHQPGEGAVQPDGLAVQVATCNPMKGEEPLSGEDKLNADKAAVPLGSSR